MAAVIPGSEHVSARVDGPVLARLRFLEAVREYVVLGTTRAAGE